MTPSREQSPGDRENPAHEGPDTPSGPGHRLDEAQVDHGLRMLLFDGVSSQVMGVLTGGALLVAFALHLGASNKVIGLIAALGPLTQLLQVPSILLVERTRRRKALAIAASLTGRLFWVIVALIPFLAPAEYRVALLVASLLCYFGATSIASTAYNSWKRDLVPDGLMARYFARRLTFATGVSAVVALASGFLIDHGGAWVGDELVIFSFLFLLGAVTGVLGVGFLGRIPEPTMAVDRERGLVEILTEPLRTENFRKLMIFLASWNFAVNLAAPFFTVYLLSRLNFSMAWVMGLSVVSQLANVLLFRVWGEIAHRLGNKRVLSFAGTLFIVSIALWPFTTMPERHLLTVPLLFVIHILAGVSTAGVNLCAGSITLKLAPRGKATAFLAANSMISGAAATIAPALAGILADATAADRLSLTFRWFAGDSGFERLVTALDLSGLDFLFVLSVIFGIYSLHRLLAVREEGMVDEEASVELYREVRRAMRGISTAAGLQRLTSFPYALLSGRRDVDERANR